MAIVETDVLVVGDFRFPGGTSTSTAAEIAALAEAGYSVLLLPVEAPFLARHRAFHPEIAGLIEAGQVALVPPEERIRARLACLHHPACFARHPSQPLHVEAGAAVLVVHHPPVDAQGVPQYDIAAVRAVTGALLGTEPDWAPVGPKVRAAFAGLDAAPPLAAEDWVGVLAPGRIGRPRPGPLGGRPVLGRHSRPDPVKWPGSRADFLSAYPDAPDIEVRLLGFGPALAQVVGPLPRNWQVLPFGAVPVGRFLAGIDYFGYFHGSAWIEAFGRSILEAMGAGLVCLLPPDFEPLFAEGAIYCAPGDVAARVRALHANPADYARQSEQAIAVLRERFAPEVAVARVAARIGPPTASPPTASLPAPATGRGHRLPRILHVTSNGIGMGHLTRALALARRHRDRAEPVIATMSRAFSVVRDEGIMAEYVPFFRGTGMAQEVWHPNLRAELTEMIRFYRPRVVVLDANVPYEGVTGAVEQFPGLWSVWLRRAMWPPGAGQGFVARQDRFDAVLEPGEIAAPFDRGPTRGSGGHVLQVAPVRYLREDEALARQAARVVLGLDPDRPAVFLQLGAGNNIRTDGLRALIAGTLAETGPPPQIVLGQWQIGRDEGDAPEGMIGLRSFPFARFLNAFDFAVAMAGYNTFHENLAACLPTLFLSNEHHEQDEQWLRADYARICGLALAARTANSCDIVRGLEEIARPDRQAALRRACARLPRTNGADEAARYLADLAHIRRPHPADCGG
ncbi:hypothetical protein [Rhodovulum euryhalinum]|uniref:UDP:flavonoid glycosyltransferase YjiC (YdhE family) n=1 Tax=Rhodovulum euryhalinum TaxID=35805 RepID=A0A4R2KG24_9RHOB|nr:hypothetical protein [Rhodovulum euryhalinum]TCO72044.1 UDP:flavonoid glycosyltransferase YjiC (YdhE family) [Rhodovulum euryhalinum]